MDVTYDAEDLRTPNWNAGQSIGSTRCFHRTARAAAGVVDESGRTGKSRANVEVFLSWIESALLTP